MASFTTKLLTRETVAERTIATVICQISMGRSSTWPGPPAVVTALRDLLVATGSDENDGRAEGFAGY